MYRILYLVPAILLFCFFSVNAQRIEVHANKDFSNNTMLNKAWGVGGALDLDQWVKKTTFRINFNWTMYKKKDNITNPNFQRISGGVSVFYSFSLTEKISLQCGGELNYTNLKHTYIYDIQHTPTDTIGGKPLTLQQTGDFIGIGPHIGIRYELTSRFCVALNFIPSYMFMIRNKSSVKTIDSEYNKGVWLFPVQLGISFKLYNPE